MCGITDVETAKRTAALGADAIGFVFAKSKRQISPEAAREIIAGLPAGVLKVGVFVNESRERVEEIVRVCGLDYAQLHGDEDEAYAQELQVPFIKAFGVGSTADVEAALRYPADYILLDSPKGAYQGGNGKKFDWSLLDGLSGEERGRIILAGGLGAENVAEAARWVQPYMVDASSSLETDGKKDLSKIQTFIETVKESHNDNLHVSRS